MEQKTKSMPKKILNKILHPNGGKKASALVSPSSSPPDNNEWIPFFMSNDDTQWSPPTSPCNFMTYYNAAYTSSQQTVTKRQTKSSTSLDEQEINSEAGSTVTRSNSLQRRYSFSNAHDTSRQRLIAAKRAEYQQKMEAFDDLIQRRRGSTLRMTLTPTY